jgi:hypothetical protein
VERLTEFVLDADGPNHKSLYRMVEDVVDREGFDLVLKGDVIRETRRKELLQSWVRSNDECVL